MTIIVQKGHEVLRKKAKNVPLKYIRYKPIQDTIQAMKDALDKEDDGVAIAAPQINKSLRIFVVSHKVFLDDIKEYQKDKSLVFINPVLTKVSKEKVILEEGCLSVRWWYGKVKRSKQATIRAFDEKGLEFSMGASGLIAQIFQHEMDHLDGILFSDKAEELEELPPVA